MKRRIRDLAIWFLMFCKRLLYKPSFLVLLAIIPIAVITVRLSVSDGSGVLKIGIVSEGTATGDNIAESLLSRDSIIHFEKFSSEDEARKAVMADKIQGAWIFPKDIEKRIAINADYGTLKPLAKVIEREESVSLQLSHEILYGALHPYVSYSNYTAFIKKTYGDVHTPSEEEMLIHYETAFEPGTVIDIKVIGEEKPAEIRSDFLSFPLRGILSVLMILCGLASVMFFKADNESGKFDWMPPSRRIIPEFGSCFAGVMLSAVPVGISLIFLGLGTDFFAEFISLVMYAFCVCGFCLVCSALFTRASRLGAITPFIVIVILAVCPIFLDMGIKLRSLFPPSLYLYAPYNPTYIGYMAVYAVCAFSLAGLLKIIMSKLMPRKRD